MKYNPVIHNRKSIRLKGFDYSQNGAYFITIVTQNREEIFGNIDNAKMMLNIFGETIIKWVGELEIKYSDVVIDEYCVMPNHFHAIIILVGAGFPRPMENKTVQEGQGDPAPTTNTTKNQSKTTIGNIMGFFKYQTSKEINILRDKQGISLWQRNYYDRIIRDEKELESVRAYIKNNPLKLEKDMENRYSKYKKATEL